MKYFAIYNNNGNYTSLRTTDLWPEDTMPENSLELTKEQWQEATVNKCKIVDGLHTVITDTQEEIEQKAFASLRSQRNKLLRESDWTQMPDSPLTDAQKQAWAIYRQSLRDLPDTVDINNIIYPEKP
jgi:hypothetical protein